MTMADDAIALAELGFAVFPIHSMTEEGDCTCGNPRCENPAKHPRTASGFLDATVNARIIKGWFGRWPVSNIGIATGERSGVVVLDVDGAEGFTSLGSKPMPATPAVATGRADGGIHYYFKHPGFKVKNLVGAEKGLDLRGDGGYVIAPPSLHKSGNHYHWVMLPEGIDAEGDSVDFAEAPEWLSKLFKKTAVGGDDPMAAPDGDIKEGGRNVELTAVAGKLRNLRFDPLMIRTSLLEWNRRYCVPPLSQEEVERIAESSANFEEHRPKMSVSIFDELLGTVEVTPLARDARLSDVGNAEVFVDLFGDRFRFDYAKKRWIVWPKGYGAWREDTSGFAERAMMATLRLRNAAANNHTQEELRKALQAWATKSESQQGIPNSLKRASRLKGISVDPNEFDRDPLVVNCFNGTLNLDTNEFSPARSADMLSRQSDVSYDREAVCPLWLKFISEIFEGDDKLINYVQRAFGYTLTGLTREQAIFVAHGNGANGKSTLLNTMKKVMGGYASATPFDTFEADSRNQYGNDLAALKGSRFVIASESEASRKLAEARVKLVTGQDPISCRFLYGEYFEYLPQFKVWLAVNHKPVIKGTDHGIWRRIHLIPFAVTFGEAGKLIDKELDLKLANELPGILNWTIEGYHLWQSEGLSAPDVVQEATAEYKRENDHTALWIEDRIGFAEGKILSATEAYMDFRDYLSSVGEVERAIPTMKAWSIVMAEKGFPKKRTAKGWVYEGLAIGQLRMTESRGN